MGKIQKYIYMAIGALILAAGQFEMLVRQDFGPGIILTSVSVIFFALGFFNVDLFGAAVKLYKGIMGLAAAINEALKSMKEAAPEKGKKAAAIPARTHGKTQAKVFVKAAPQVEAKGFRLFLNRMIENLSPAGTKPGSPATAARLLNFEFQLPKITLLFISIFLLLASQYYLFTQKLPSFFALIIVAAVVFVYYIIIKEPKITISLTLEKGFKLLLLLCGAVLLLVGWLFLLKQNIKLQEFGTFLTVAGIILSFFGLPENADKRDAAHRELKEEILFSDMKLINNTWFKIAMFILMVVFVMIGNKLIPSQDTNMVSIYFYMAAIGCLFFWLPLFNYREKPLIDNPLTRIIRLVVIAAGFLIALKGQVFFTQHNVNEAVKYFFIAGFLFIFAAPVYNAEKEDDNLPVKLEILFLIAITAIALWLRLYDLDLRPFGIENDEAGGFINHFIEKQKGNTDYYVGNYGLGFNLTALYSWLAGGNTGRIVMKLVGVTLGVVAVPIMYFFIRKAINARTAIFVTVIFTFLRWSVHYGRTSHFGFFTVFGILGAVYFIILAVQRRDKLSYLMSGLFLGLMWHGVLTGFLGVIPPALYFTFKSFHEKGFFRKNFTGILAFALGLWIFTSIMVHNYFISSSIYFSRTHEVSVFSGDPNAPSNIGQGIVNNTQSVLLMFNHLGDSRQRNSGGMPNEPTVDFMTAVFFGIGFIYCMYYSRNYIFFIMVMLFYSQAAGSIFSIEAPSSMRAMGTMAPMLYFAGVAFNAIWQSVKNVFGRNFSGKFLYPILLIGMLWFPVKDNYHEYFERWIGGMDELSTAAGMYSAKIGEKYRIMLFTATYYPGHPPYRFYRRDFKVSNTDCPEDGFQPITQVTDENYAIFHHYDTWEMLPYWERKFPNAKVEEVDHHYFNKKVKPGEGMGKFFTAQLIDNADIQKIRGLTANYSYSDGSTEKVLNDDAAFTPDRAAKAPYRVSWSGQLYFIQFGDTAFTKTGNAQVTLYINGKKVEWGRDYMVPKGFSKVRIEAVRKDKSDNFSLSYVMKHYGMTSIFRADPINKQLYYSDFMPEGLHAYFYNGTAWQENSLQWEQIDPYVYYKWASYIGNYYSLKWTGWINIPEDGEYTIMAPGGAYSRCIIDDKWHTALGSLSNDANIQAYLARQHSQPAQNYFLRKGKHSIEILSTRTQDLKITWKRGQGKPEEIVPPELFSPNLDLKESKSDVTQPDGAVPAGNR